MPVIQVPIPKNSWVCAKAPGCLLPKSNYLIMYNYAENYYLVAGCQDTRMLIIPSQSLRLSSTYPYHISKNFVQKKMYVQKWKKTILEELKTTQVGDLVESMLNYIFTPEKSY